MQQMAYLIASVGPCDEPARVKWLRHWVDAGSRAVEEVLARDPRTGEFRYGY